MDNQTKIARRFVLSGAVALAAATPAVFLAAPAPASDTPAAAMPDPVVTLYAEYLRLCVAVDSANLVADAVWERDVPEWAQGDDPLLARSSHVPEMRHSWTGSPDRRISLDTIRSENRATESVVDPQQDGWGDRDQWCRRRAEGRARLRWWVSERRAIIAAQGTFETACAYAAKLGDDLSTVERQIRATPATSLEGVMIKLHLAMRRFEDATEDSLDTEDGFIRSASRDIEQLAAMGA